MKEGKAHEGKVKQSGSPTQCVALLQPLLNKLKTEDGENSEESGNGEYVSHCVALQCAKTLL